MPESSPGIATGALPYQQFVHEAARLEALKFASCEPDADTTTTRQVAANAAYQLGALLATHPDYANILVIERREIEAANQDGDW